MFSDDFNRANENLTAPWTVTGASGALAVQSGSLAALAATAGGDGLALCPDQGSPNQYVEFTVKDLGTLSTGSFVVCRCDGTTDNLIGIRVNPNSNVGGIEILRRVAGSFGVIQVGARTASINTRLRLELDGDTWRLLRDAEGVIETGGIGDGGALAANTGQGVWSRLADQNELIDDFEAGPLVALQEYTLDAELGAFAISGSDAELIVSRLLSAESGAFGISGQDAVISVSRLLNAEAGAFLITGSPASLVYGTDRRPPASRRMAADSVVRNISVDAETRTFSLTGSRKVKA